MKTKSPDFPEVSSGSRSSTIAPKLLSPEGWGYRILPGLIQKDQPNWPICLNPGHGRACPKFKREDDKGEKYVKNNFSENDFKILIFFLKIAVTVNAAINLQEKNKEKIRKSSQ